MFISLGPTCHPAGNLNKLNLRKQSLPFDWLLCDYNHLFEYVNDLINTNFKYFTSFLVYNESKKVISEKYKYAQFYHHDLIKNKTDIKENKYDKRGLIEKMNDRSKKFMSIISKNNENVTFLCILHHTNIIENGKLKNLKLYEDMQEFDNNKNIKCNFKVLVYLYNDNEDYNLIIPDELKELKNFIFDKYIRNQTICSIYGDINDFKNLLKKNKLL